MCIRDSLGASRRIAGRRRSPGRSCGCFWRLARVLVLWKSGGLSERCLGRCCGIGSPTRTCECGPS
eukprot:6547504-Alexandrium_andersonii.AAC.1